MNRMETCCQNQKTGNFTPAKFLFTGREILVEIRGSLHTFRGKFAFALFLAGIIVGFLPAAGGAENRRELAERLMISLCFSNIGLIIMMSLQNHRLTYLLPVSRKEFAAMQIRKMAWVSMILLLIASAEFACADQRAEKFWWDIVAKAIPVSLGLSSCQIATVQPIKGSKKKDGTKWTGFSGIIMVQSLDAGITFINLVSTGGFWSIPASILPALNYLISFLAIGYFYRKTADASLYYDEL